MQNGFKIKLCRNTNNILDGDNLSSISNAYTGMGKSINNNNNTATMNNNIRINRVSGTHSCKPTFAQPPICVIYKHRVSDKRNSILLNKILQTNV